MLSCNRQTRARRRAAPGVVTLGAFCLALLTFGAAAEARPAVSDIRVGQHPDKTRFVVDLSEEAAFQVFTLADPYRVVIDLPEVDWRLPFASGTRGAGDVLRVRFDVFKAGTSRIVLDLKQPLQVVDAFLLPGAGVAGRRLVIDMKPTSRDRFLVSAGWPEDGQMAAPPVPVAAPEPVTDVGPGRRVIVLDPGHGGRDQGARGVEGTDEAEVVLEMAEDLKKEIEKADRYDVVLTRDKNVGIALRDRIAIARREKADLFISLHADKIGNAPGIRGMSVYTLSKNASDDEAATLAAKENRADVILGVDLSDNSDEVNLILIDLAMRETMNSSTHFAKLLMPELAKSTLLLKNTHRFAGFAVLKAPDVPSVLIELGYLSNEVDEKNLNSSQWRRLVSASIVTAIDAYFASEVPETWSAAQ